MIGQKLPDDDRTLARIIKSLPTLNKHQLTFVHFGARIILSTAKIDESQDAPEVDTNHITDDELLGFDDLLRMTSRLPLPDIHGILVSCERLDRRLGSSGAMDISDAALYPDHPPASKQPESDTAQVKLGRLIVQCLMLDDNARDDKLALLKSALQMAKHNSLPRTHIEAMILDITGGNRSKLIPGYESELANARHENNWSEVHQLLESLFNESYRQGDKQAARGYLNQAKDFLRELIWSDDTLLPGQHREGYMRTRLRTFYERLLLTERQLDDEA